MKRVSGDRIFIGIGYIVLIICAAVSVLPLIFMISGSFSSESSVIRTGYGIIPNNFSLDAYGILFRNPTDLIDAFAVSISVTVAGTAISVFISAMTSYVLAHRDFKYRNKFSVFIYITCVFSGGLVPWYLLMVNFFNMKNNILAMILPMLINVFYILIMKSFMLKIPFDIVESARIDGCGEFKTFYAIILPVSKPIIITISVFTALGYWNNYFNALLFITKDNLEPLQYYLFKILRTSEALNRVAAMTGMAVPEMPKETLKLALSTLIVIPVAVVYPFAQKYIVGGVMVGAVKG
jgi:putative aldouronate transport system permease protein